MNPDLQRLQRLTPLRMVAAVLVVLFHFGQPAIAQALPALLPLARQGSLAVSFFFCLSGFIMAAVYRQAMGPHEARDYWVARFARIYPVYLLALLLVLPLRGMDAPGLVLSAALLQAWFPPYALTLNAPGWSLSVEAAFYAFFPWAAGALVRGPRRLALLAAALWVCTQALTSAALHRGLGEPGASAYNMVFYSPLMHVNEFLLGAAACGLLRAGWSALRLGLLLAAGQAVALIVLQATAWPASGSNGLYAPAFCALFCAVVTLPGLGWLQRRELQQLGESSYGVYILQVPVMLVLARWLPLAQPAGFALALLGLVLVCIAVHLALERPCRAGLRRAWRHRSAGRGVLHDLPVRSPE